MTIYEPIHNAKGIHPDYAEGKRCLGDLIDSGEVKEVGHCFEGMESVTLYEFQTPVRMSGRDYNIGETHEYRLHVS